MRLPQQEDSEPDFPFVSLVDLDHGGDLGLATAMRMWWNPAPFYMNDGRGNFAPWQPPLALTPFDFGDIDGDGWRDLLFVVDREEETPDRYFAMRGRACPVALLPVIRKAGECSEPAVDGSLHVIP